jgi:hypothetical protein
MYGAAVLDACEQIIARMQPVSSREKHGSFAEVIYFSCLFFGFFMEILMNKSLVN